MLDIFGYQLAGEQSLRYAHHVVHNLVSEPKWKLIIFLDQCQLQLAKPLVLMTFSQLFWINFDIEFLYLFEFP